MGCKWWCIGWFWLYALPDRQKCPFRPRSRGLFPSHEWAEHWVPVFRVGFTLVVPPRQGGWREAEQVRHCCCHPVPPLERVIGIVASTCSGAGRSSRSRISEVPVLRHRGSLVWLHAPGRGGLDPVGPGRCLGTLVGAIVGRRELGMSIHPVWRWRLPLVGTLVAGVLS